MDIGATARIEQARGSTSVKTWVLIAALLALAVGLRFAARTFMTGDVEFWVIPWYDHLKANGFHAFAGQFPNDGGYKDVNGNYPPPYHYLIYVSTWFDGLAPRLTLIKAVSVFFDFVAAAFLFKIVEHVTGSTTRAWYGVIALLLAPTLIFNGALWGQCDIVHTSLMLGAVYFSLRSRPLAIVVLMGAAISFKAQPVFLVPYLLLLAACGRIKPWHLLVVPVMYVVMMMPAIVLGRSVSELLLVYVRQGQFFDKLSMNSANLYFFMSNDNYATVSRAGVLVTMAVSMLYAVLPRLKRTRLTDEFLLLAATVSVAMSPFLLPKMHDRYFLPADVFSIALACAFPRYWYIALGFQISSGLSYVPIITDSLTHYGGEYVGLMPHAAIVNTILVAVLFGLYGRAVWGAARRPALSPTPAR